MKALLIDDDPSSLMALERYLKDPLGYEVITASNCREGLELYQQDPVPLVLSDIKMEGMTGLEFLRKIKSTAQGQHSDVLLMTGFGDLQGCIDALRAGASDYLLKPISVSQLDVILKRIRANRTLRMEHASMLKELGGVEKSVASEANPEMAFQLLRGYHMDHDVGFYSSQSRKIQTLCEKLHEQREIPVLIEGETGTGKEVIARLLHGGKQEKRPFVSVNCSAIPATLFESELFGYAEGAFTGARRKGASGRIEEAQGGTLFLDEIGELPVDMQPKLLRVIQERELRRVGAGKAIKLDMRIVCATNRGLQQLVGEGRFRSDLYYRLNTGYIHLPPLRERVSEIFPLARLFLGLANKRSNKEFTSISRDAVHRMEDYRWPGNIRELKSVIDRAVLLYEDSCLQAHHLEALTAPEEHTMGNHKALQLDLPEGGYPLKEMHEKIARTVLEKMGGNVTRAANYLDVAWATLSRMARLK